MSPAFKIGATQAVAKIKRIRTVPQLMNAKVHVEEGGDGADNKGSLAFARTERFNYVVSAVRQFEGTTSLGIVCDGSTMGSDELLAVNFTSGERKVGCFGPSQASWGEPPLQQTTKT